MDKQRPSPSLSPFGRSTEFQEDVVGRPVGGTRERILDGARAGLLDAGYAGLSTRRVADGAGVPLSQLHYHFGGKRQLILAVLARENERLIDRQTRMYGEDRPLWQRYEQACDFLDEDVASGYVRVLQEMIAAGWADGDIANAVRRLLNGWFQLLTEVAAEAERVHGQLGPFSAAELGTLICLLFMGGESMLLLDLESEQVPIRQALRRFGELIRQYETGETT
ncbi:MAG: TetR/AcrR family transcriptional regulator [Actinomycetota bacterium]|nr:TetR/AcrR family transcriptional regulator [Actinomycetota bacterium]